MTAEQTVQHAREETATLNLTRIPAEGGGWIFLADDGSGVVAADASQMQLLAWRLTHPGPERSVGGT